jgi:hypothetical protein
MPRLPDFELHKRVNNSPHVVILGAGASRAAFPDGDAKKRRLPLMVDLIDCLGLHDAIRAAGFADETDFEAIYDELATTERCPSLRAEIESRVRDYFELMELPEAPTLYDYLLLSLREKDSIASFNWDPFLAKAFIRNRDAAALPRILFLHGNVEIGICAADKTKGFKGDTCRKCGAPLQPTKLLYPVRQKDYKSDPFIASEWSELEASLNDGYMLTIFGYGAPATDVEAVDLMLRGWGANPTFELAQVQIIDTKPEEQLEKTWERFLCRTHYSTSADLWRTWLLKYPRRSCEALAMATLQNDPWRDNPFPKLKSLSQLHAWIAPLVAEESKGRFTGTPCLQGNDFGPVQAQMSRRVRIDWVVSWLKTMCKREPIPPFCVELVLKDGTRYNLHSIVSSEDETKTLCARIWDLRAFRSNDINALKQRLNEIRERSALAPAEAVHPKLDWANLHLHYDDVAYCVEWHDRIWPDDKGTKQVRHKPRKPVRTPKKS